MTHPLAYGLNIRVPFKKHRGETLAQIIQHDPGFVIWLADEAKSPTWRKLAALALGLLEEPEEDPTEQSAVTMAMAMPYVLFAWEQAMKREYGDLPTVADVIAHGLLEFKKLCERYTRRPWPELREDRP